MGLLVSFTCVPVVSPGCDKNMPGVLIAMGRVNRPSIMVYGGTIKPGCSSSGETLDIVSAFQSYGQYISGSATEEERQDIVANSSPGAGACGGMYTATTMASAIEALGMSLPYSSSIPAEDPLKKVECYRAGAALKNLMEVSHMLTRLSFVVISQVACAVSLSWTSSHAIS